MPDTDSYPWGAQLPAKRTAELQKQLTGIANKREAAIEAHRKALAAFDEQERSIKADLKIAATFAEKQLREQAAQSVAKTVEKLLVSGKIAASVLTDGAALEAALLNALGSAETAVSKPRKGKAE